MMLGERHNSPEKSVSMITENLRFVGKACRTTTGSRLAFTFPWMAMNDVASEQPDSRFEQRRIFCRGVSCARSRSLQALFSPGSSLPNRHRLLQCDLCIFFRASVSALSDRLLPLSCRMPVDDRSPCELRLLLYATTQPLGLSTGEAKQKIAVMQRGVGGIVKGQSVTYTLSDGKKIQKVTDMVTRTGSVVRSVSPRELGVLQGEIPRRVSMSLSESS